MSEVVHTVKSADGRLRVEVVARPEGGCQLACSRFKRQLLPEYGHAWEGWVPVPRGVTLTGTPERGAALAAEALALWESEEAGRVSESDPHAR